MDTTGDINASAEEAADPMAGFSRDAAPWNELIKDGGRCFQTYNDKCDSIDKLYAHLENMAKVKTDREFQIFWANLEVLKPSIYSRPPVPVVVPRFKDMDETTRKASEVLERTLITTFDVEDIDATMRAIRDDLAINSRGVPWLRYESSGDEKSADDNASEPQAESVENFTEKVCFDHLDRKDFLHEPARKWKEVGWVARRSWLSMEEGRKRFKDAFLSVKMERRKIDDGKDYEGEKKGEVWEIWSKTKGVVVWVSPGVAEVLDAQPPFLTLDGFFPCPRPAYGTLQRNSLIPVPDFLYYRDQIEEINELTARISALCESLRMKGFYASGQENLSSAIEIALKQQDNAAILIPVPSFSLVAGSSIKDAIVWLPVNEIATVVKELILNRKQLIEDVYQITGLSDIMRGDSNASETLGAQKLKSQYGSVRIRDRQGELVRIAKDMTRMAAEIIAENFQPETLRVMSQVKLPSEADLQQKMMQQAPMGHNGGPPMPGAPMGAPPMMPRPGMAPQPPQAAPPMPAPAQQTQDKPVTFEAVMALFRADRSRPFVLDVETDSTIQPDEDAEKQRATEYITAVGGFMQQALPVGQALPQAIPLIGAMLKFSASKFRAGREMQGTIEKFVDEMTEFSKQPKPPKPDPEMVKAEAEKQRMAMDMQHTQMKAQSDQAMAQANIQIKQLDLQLKQLELQGKAHETQAKGHEAQARIIEANSPDPGESPEATELTRAQIAKTYAEAEQIRGATLMDPLQDAQALDHAERQMQLAETAEPEGAE